MSKNIKDMLKEAKLPERTVVLCLNQDLNAALEDAERRLDVALQGPDTASLNGSSHPELRAEVDDLKEQMAERNQEFTFRALPRNTYTLLLKRHPAKEGSEVDEQNGFAFDEVTEALIHTCLVSPEMDDEDWAMLLGDGTDDFPGVLSSVQYDMLAAAVWRVNRRDVDVPFLLKQSQSLQTSVKP